MSKPDISNDGIAEFIKSREWCYEIDDELQWSSGAEERLRALAAENARLRDAATRLLAVWDGAHEAGRVVKNITRPIWKLRVALAQQEASRDE
jgi:hypothetical protein